MERVQRTVEIKLTPEECEILWKAEQLLREMEKEISGITICKQINLKGEEEKSL